MRLTFGGYTDHTHKRKDQSKLLWSDFSGRKVCVCVCVCVCV